MAAGSRFNFVVVDTPITAEKCINYLKKNNLGRASFIPLSKIRANPLRDSLSNNPRICGKALDLITFKPQYIAAFEFIFGRIVIVEDLLTARQLKLPVKRVTLDGDVVDGSNLMTGGQRGKSRGTGFKSLETDKIGQLEMQYQQYSQKSKDIESNISQIQHEISRLYKLKISGANQTKEISEKIAVCNSKIEHIKNSIKDDESEIEEILINLKEFENQKVILEDERKIFQEKLIILREEEKKIQEELDSSDEGELRLEIKKVEKELRKLRKEASKIEIEFTKKSTMLVETITSNRSDYLNQINQKAMESTEIVKNLQKMTEELNAGEIEHGLLDEKINQKSEILSTLYSQKKALTIELSEKKMEFGQLSQPKHEAQMKLNRFILKTEEFTAKIQEYKCHLLPDITFPVELLEHEENWFQTELTLIGDKKQRLGTVNLRSIEKYDEINKRFMELEAKNEQVIEEREAIIRFMEALEEEKTRVFMKTFNGINSNFQTIFTKLSPGGDARMELENPESPFDAGIKLMARPGEKKLCSIRALSGGERSLCIIALILAIQKHKSCPWIVLDEVDAPLDDANCGIVADMIKELSNTSQFIMITHRDVSMARTDQLLGISNIGGLSSVINLSIREVLSQISADDENAIKAA
jgi:chromosome segregation protein